MGRAPCCDKSGLKKGPWTPEEDHLLTRYIQTHGPGSWRALPKKAGLQRCGKSCRLRWTNYLRPDIKRGRFSFEEEEVIIQLHSVLGNQWSAIAARLPGRTDNEIKNYWNTHIRKRLIRIGIDPVTHTRRLDHLELTSFLSGTGTSDLSLSNLFGIQQPAVTNLDLFSLRLQQLILQKQETQRGNPNLANQIPSEFQFQPDQLQSPMLQTLLLNNQPGELMKPNFSCGRQYFNILSDLSGDVGPENANARSLDSNRNPQNFGFDSVLSTPLSSSPTPVNSLSALGCGSADEERESYCSELLKFQIPESLDIAEFM